jgi:tRNA/tmRNA/rRNA uracil-C5-methylase (TrmA/RlmC/RlmD family)
MRPELSTSPASRELTLVAGAPANGGSCVAHHEGRVVFVRYALPGERVRVRVTADRGSYWHAETVEVLDPSADRIASLCPIAGVDGAGCCDLAFATPEAARALKAQVVANQLERLGGHQWIGEAETLSDSGPTGWRTRVRLDVGSDRRPGFHRYHSDELVTDLRCAQLTPGLLDGLAELDWPPSAQLHVAVDDDGERHVVRTLRQGGRTATKVVEGGYEVTQRVGQRAWQVPVTAFWQAHRDAARVYYGLVADWAQPGPGMRVWDLYGGAGVGADRRYLAGVVASRTCGPGRSAAGSRRHRFGAPGIGSATIRRRRGGAGPASIGCRTRGDRPTGRCRGVAGGAYRL